MKPALVLLGCAIAFLPATAAGSTTHAPRPAAARAAFGRLLHQLYGGDVRGYWSCPRTDTDTQNKAIYCWGEVRSGGRRHQVFAAATRRLGGIALDDVVARTWSRRWSPYSGRVLRRGVKVVTGVASVNSPAYDWGWVAECAAELRVGQARTCPGIDGQYPGPSRMFSYPCRRLSRALIACHNSLGDAMRYRPHG